METETENKTYYAVVSKLYQNSRGRFSKQTVLTARLQLLEEGVRVEADFEEDAVCWKTALREQDLTYVLIDFKNAVNDDLDCVLHYVSEDVKVAEDMCKQLSQACATRFELTRAVEDARLAKQAVPTKKSKSRLAEQQLQPVSDERVREQIRDALCKLDAEAPMPPIPWEQPNPYFYFVRRRDDFAFDTQVQRCVPHDHGGGRRMYSCDFHFHLHCTLTPEKHKMCVWKIPAGIDITEKDYVYLCSTLEAAYTIAEILTRAHETSNGFFGSCLEDEQ